jgi:PAS domain S-box-containing protein
MSSREVRLLLVDDDPSAIQVMSRMLAQYPAQRFATSGEVALRLAREAPPDLIVLDLDMPGMSGFDVCKALKSDPVLAQVPVIFATSHTTTALEIAALQTGAADFLTKPLVAAQVTARVRAQLRAKLRVENLTRERLDVGAAPLSQNARTPRLLIVDDDVAAIRILQSTLADIGDIHFAKSGEEALRLARSLRPQLILLDAHMPDLDGFEVFSSLKADPIFEHTPIVFVTRFADPRNEMRALDLGAADFIAKPYTPAVLVARVRNLLDHVQRTDAELHAVREHWRKIGDARVAAIVAGASDAIVSYDSHGALLLANDAACKMFGRKSQQMIGLPIRELLGDALNASPLPAGPVRIVVTLGAGGTFPAEASLSCVGEGSAMLTTVMLRDVRDRERLESESRARSEAEAASRTKTLMLSYVAHEMGNPLNGLLGFAQLMESDSGHPLGPEQSKRLECILASGRQLEVLMRDVLDLGRFESGKLAFELSSLDATRCVKDAVTANAALAARAGVSLTSTTASPTTRVVADAGRLNQCLLNLITNAVKYNRPGGWVRIELQEEAGEVVISVRDNGVGIDDSQRRHLFEPFNRLGREGTKTPGAGLGLVITRQLVSAMNGRLEVESEPGLGSTFSIVMPSATRIRTAVVASAEAAIPPPQQAPPG